jgi:hypothetical protein
VHLYVTEIDRPFGIAYVADVQHDIVQCPRVQDLVLVVCISAKHYGRGRELTAGDSNQELGLAIVMILPQGPPVLRRKIVRIASRGSVAHVCKLFGLLVRRPFRFDGAGDGIGHGISSCQSLQCHGTDSLMK